MKMVLSAATMLAGLTLARGAPEGQALIEELAQEVKSYQDEKILPVPYEIQLVRDVGDLTFVPVKEELQAKVKLGSLGTGREVTEGRTPLIMVGRAVTQDKEAPVHPPPSYRLSKIAADQKVHLNGAVNPTRELSLQGWQRNKWVALKGEMDYWKQRNSGKLVVVFSSGDTLYGGCTETELQAKYEAVVAASGVGATIVIAGEVSPMPVDLGWKYNLTKYSSISTRRASALAKLGFPEGWEAPYLNCSDPEAGPCGPAPKYQYGNSGFFMGPVGDIVEMLESGDLMNYVADDNTYINEYMLVNPSKVTIDYAGELVTSLHNMNVGGGPVEFHQYPIDNSTTGTMLKHKVSGKKVCFLHGNGNGISVVKKLAEEIVGDNITFNITAPTPRYANSREELPRHPVDPDSEDQAIL